ncbi:MAG: hypothetical protein IJY93_09065 [Clostridia bacterium]|nr:hypothetical protein [Clostridia bacterium]
MQKNTEKRTTNPLGGFLGYLISVVISVIAVIYLGYHFLGSLGNELTTEYAIQVTENDLALFDAYIFRNETVVYSEKTGGIGYAFPDGTKVKVDSILASIYGGDAATGSAARNEIIAIDREIELLNESNSTDGLAVSDTKTLDSRIDSYYMAIRQNAEEGVYSGLTKRRDEFLTLLNKRQIITGKIESFDGVIEDLTEERDRLTSGLDSINETVTAHATGFFYSTLDGYESIFTADQINRLTPEIFSSLIESEPESYDSHAIGKIATDFSWYIVLEATHSDLRSYNEGYTYDVIFPYNNDTKLAMKLSKVITSQTDQRVLLVFSSHESPEDFSFDRMQPVEVVRSSHTGYKVPISAVRLSEDGRMGVYILVGTTVDFRYIDVLLESDGYYIVAPRSPENDPEYYTKLGLYDIIITGGKNLYVGKIIT